MRKGLGVDVAGQNDVRIFSFPPVSHPSATTLILGSMPGEASLAAGQYYAHRMNGFWRILNHVIDLDAAAPYEARLRSLMSAGIALWDVVHSCERSGSLDSDIKSDSIQPNDFRTFFAKHPRIRLVCFNGTMAEKSFRKCVVPTLECEGIRFVRFPSTSPANTMSFEKKLEAWKNLTVLQHFEDTIKTV